MAGASETLLVQDQTAKSSLIAIKKNQNLVIDLEPCKYDRYLLLIVECLKYSPLTVALTEMENVPMSHLSKSYSFGTFLKVEERITLEILNHKTSISKS